MKTIYFVSSFNRQNYPKKRLLSDKITHVIMHRFSSPAWVKHVQKAITPLQTLTTPEMAALGSGEAYLWANKASDKAITQRSTKIVIRPSVTKHGGDTIQAVK